MFVYELKCISDFLSVGPLFKSILNCVSPSKINLAFTELSISFLTNCELSNPSNLSASSPLPEPSTFFNLVKILLLSTLLKFTFAEIYSGAILLLNELIANVSSVVLSCLAPKHLIFIVLLIILSQTPKPVLSPLNQLFCCSMLFQSMGNDLEASIIVPPLCSDLGYFTLYI